MFGLGFFRRLFTGKRDPLAEIRVPFIIRGADAARISLEMAKSMALLQRVSPDAVPKSEQSLEMTSDEIAKVIRGQISQQFDYYRMFKFWERLLAGPTPPKVVAAALCQELSHGRYVERDK
jgi:hypothetical protein